MTARRVLILIPHPDDEVVGCAIAARRARAEGATLWGLYLTTGIPSRDQLWPWQRRGYERRVERRRREAIIAAKTIGISPVRFQDWPSRTLKAHLDEAAALIKMPSLYHVPATTVVLLFLVRTLPDAVQALHNVELA